MAKVNFGVHVLFIVCITQLACGDDNLNPEWEKPDAFSKQKSLSSGKPLHLNEARTERCEQCVNVKDDNLPSLYKKLAKFLLKRKSMKFDDTSRLFYRSLHLHITEEQMNRFEEMTDVHDMDQLIAEVLYQSRSGTYELFKEMYLTWKDTFALYWEMLMSSRQVVLAVQFSIFVLIWFASRRFHFSFSVVALFFVLFYLYSFLDSECHRKKDIEKAAQMFGKHDNPCNKTSFWSYYFRNQNEDCKRYLDNTYDASCTLVDVYEEFINVIVYKQMWNFIDNSVANIFKVYATYGIVATLIVISICTYLFNNSANLIINSVFHNLFKSRGSNSRSTDSIRTQQNITGAGDTISTEVLNKILEITRDQTKINALHLTRMTSNSGVQSVDNVDGGNESTESCENLNVSEVEVESVQIITTSVALTESVDSKNNDKLTIVSTTDTISKIV